MSIFTSVIKCGICGEPLSGAGNPYTCAVCGNVSYTSNPMLEDELRTANAMRECTRFDEAMLVYKQIVKKYKTDDLSEVYWNLLLCEQRVMFETDEKGERFPSFYAIVSDDVEDSPYYTCALSAAEKHAPERVAIFTEMAEKMARAKQLYARIRESEKPYDVFICFKKSKLDGSGEETPDTDLAEDLYNQFAKDYRIFFSERTLRDVAVRDFEPNIYYALYTAKVLLLLCSKREYIDSKWVKNEWSRYHAMAQNPATGKTVIPVFLEDFEPGNLPAELLSYQGLADGRQLMGALESTLRKILKPLDMEAELNRRMQEMLAEQRRQNEEQQRKMQEQLEAIRKEKEQIDAQKKNLEELSRVRKNQTLRREQSTHESGKKLLQEFDFSRNTKKGAYIKFGTYKQGKSNNKKPIEWLVLDVKDNKALVISKYALDCKRYHTSNTSVTWETCSLREWLNDDFINVAFSAKERAMIPTVTVTAGRNPRYGTNPGNTTQDRVFLLSIIEVEKYFSSDNARQCKATEHAIVNGSNNSDGNCLWWLRSPASYQYRAARVDGDGDIREYGSNVYDSGTAVRPAMWIDLNA